MLLTVGNNAVSFSEMAESWLPLGIKNKLSSSREKRKIGKKRTLANTALGWYISPKVIINRRFRI